MRKTFLIWIIGGLINLLYMWILVWVLGYFVEAIHTPIVWMVLNFVPITLLLGYFYAKHINVESKTSTILLLLFLIFCFLSVLSRIFLPDFQKFEKAIQYSPFFLIPLQIIVVFMFFRQSRVANQKSLSKNSEFIGPEEIKNMEIQEVTNRLKMLMEKRRTFQADYDIASDASIKFNLKENIARMNKQIELLKQQMEKMTNGH